MKKRTRDAELLEPNKRIYKASLLSKDIKSFAVALYFQFKEDSVTLNDFVSKMKSAGYEVSERGFERYVQSFKATGSAVRENETRGAKSLLNGEQKSISIGWVFSQNDINKIVQLKHYINFIKESFDVKISVSALRIRIYMMLAYLLGQLKTRVQDSN